MTKQLTVYVGGLQVLGWRQLPRFFRQASSIKKQAMTAQGCRFVDLSRKSRIFFVVTVWDTPADLKRFAISEPHRTAMVNAATLVRMTRNINYQSSGVPTRRDAIAQWEATATAD